jgi:TPR repeat protein
MAADLFEEGSASGNAHCMLVFGRCFEAGYGREQDQEKAIYWFSKSAEKGNAEAVAWCEKNQIDYLKVVAEK